MMDNRYLIAGLALALTANCSLGQDPTRPTEAQPGTPGIRLLVTGMSLGGQPLIDEAYRNRLAEKGFAVTVVTNDNLLSAEFLRQFPVTIVSGLPHAGAAYDVFGYKLRYSATNSALLRAYVAEGGGLVVIPAMVEFGEAYGETYNAFLAPFGAQYLIQQVRDEDSAGKTPYATGVVLKNHPITKAMSETRILYPVQVMRWDNAYSATPLLLDAAWSVLAQGGPSAGTAIALNNHDVGPRQTPQRVLFAVRPFQKGLIAASAVGAYYTLTAVSSKAPALGENDTGVIDFAVIAGEKEGRPSAFGELLENTYRALASNSLAQGIGRDAGVALPAQEPYPESPAVIDWKTQQPPPTWAHRVIVSGTWPKIYDELPDPLVKGELTYWKALVGPRTRYSSGTGSVREYREAALKAGYHAVVFAETLADLTAKTWRCLTQDCADNSDDTFVCLPGLELEGVNGGRYLVLGSDRYPDPAWLSADGKRLAAIRMLSLGWHGQLSVMHRPNGQKLSPAIFKQYQGIAVASYDTKGQLVDDGLFAYQWAVANDCNPIPLAVHEVTSPADVAKAAAAGFQQILPAPTLRQAVDYFRFAMPHFFDCPPRYFISEGPVLDGWSIFNKDKGKADLNREHYRLGVGVRSADRPLAEVQLFDGFQAVRRWLPGTNEVRAVVDGFHDMQHLYLLMARDQAGRRVLSPGIRTTTRNWRLRCGDRQNWLGHFWIYTGWNLNSMPGYALKLAGTSEGTLGWNHQAGGNPCPIFDYRFFSDHVQIADADFGAKYMEATWDDIGGDGANGAPVRPTDVVDGRIRARHFTELKRPDFAVLEYEVDLRLKQDAVLDAGSPLNPVMGGVFKGNSNNLIILPGKEPEPLFPVDPKTKRKDLKAARTLDLPPGSYVAGVIPLTDGLTLHGDRFGYRVGPSDVANALEGTRWSARYLILDSLPFKWRHSRNWGDSTVDDKALQALEEMGFRGKPPYALELRQGRLERIAYYAHLTAQDGGVAGRCVNDSGRPMLFHVPLLIGGLRPRVASVLWRSDTGALEHFASYQGTGHVPFDADRSVEFYAGAAATCDPRLAVEIVAWGADEARFRVHNPTREAIAGEFATPAAVKGYKPVKRAIAVPPGTSLEVE